MTKEYKCECGKIFTSPNSFNGHKSGCKEHHIAKYGNLDFYNQRYKKSVTKSTNTLRNRFDSLANEKLQQWISEQHTCEKCGKIMTEKYGSGRFCSRACANSHDRTEESKKKTSEKLKVSYVLPPNCTNKDENKLKYLQNPKRCPICNSIIPYEIRFHHTCGHPTCINNQISIKVSSNPNCGGCRPHSGWGKSGIYKGYYCDSTYELVYIIYNLDHNIKFERNKRYYLYEYKGKTYKYYPDFLLENNTLVEIKGYMDDKNKVKIAAVKDREIIVLMRDDLQYAFDYVKSSYEYKDLTDLYDKKDIVSQLNEN